MIFKTKVFSTLTNSILLPDKQLLKACEEIENGIYDASLGGKLFKKRIGAINCGKRGSFRVIVGAKFGEKYFFIYSFAKNQKANINARELKALKELAKELFKLNNSQIEQLVKDGELIKIGDL